MSYIYSKQEYYHLFEWCYPIESSLGSVLSSINTLVWIINSEASISEIDFINKLTINKLFVIIDIDGISNLSQINLKKSLKASLRHELNDNNLFVVNNIYNIQQIRDFIEDNSKNGKKKFSISNKCKIAISIIFIFMILIGLTSYIYVLRNENSQQAELIDALQQEIIHTNLEYNELYFINHEQNTTIVNLQYQISQQNSTIVNLQNELVEKNIIIDELNSTIGELQYQISQQDSTICDLQNEVNDKNIVIDELNSTIVELQNEVDELNFTIAIQQNEIIEKNIVIDELNTTIVDLQNEIGDKNIVIDELNSTIVDLQNEVDELNSTIAIQQNEIIEKNFIISQQNITIIELQNQLYYYENSTSIY